MTAYEPDVEMTGRTLTIFGRGPFRGSDVAGTVLMEDRAATTTPIATASPVAGIHPVTVSDFSAPNAVRRGVVRFLAEWWTGRPVPMSGQVFIRQPMTSAPVRAQSAPRGFTKLVPSRRGSYDPGMYGSSANSDQNAAARRCRRG